MLRNVATDLHCKNPIKDKGYLLACFRARFRTHSATPLLTVKQDTGKGSHDLQTDAGRQSTVSSRAALGISNPQETGAGNACVIAQDPSMTESAQRAVPTQPAGCHSDSDRYLENALLSCESCVQGCPTAIWTWSSLQPISKVWGLQLHSYLDSSQLPALTSTIITIAPLLHTDLS